MRPRLRAAPALVALLLPAIHLAPAAARPNADQSAAGEARVTSPRSEAAVYSGGDTSGCGKSHLLPGITQERKIVSSNVERKYSIHLPASYDPNKRYPTILGFHGSSSIPLFLEVDTGLSLPTYTADKIMVYPAGLEGNWAGASYAKATLDQDLQFVADLLADVRRNYCVDSARIYATGLSNGGGFVGSLACDSKIVGREFAAFAPVAGAFYTDVKGLANENCVPARSITPILEFHGGSDESVHYDGGQGQGGLLPSIRDWVGWWAQRNGCDPPVTEDSFNGDVHHTTYNCRGVTGVVQHYKTDSQKHNWPSPLPNFSQLASGDRPTHLEASRLIQSFFLNFARPAE